MVILIDMVSGCITFSEAPCLERKCGTRRSDNLVRALYSTTPRLWQAGQTWVPIPPCVDSLLWYSICWGREVE
jgi:hypothetical protein